MNSQNKTEAVYPDKVEPITLQLNGEDFTVEPMCGKPLIRVAQRAVKLNGFLSKLPPDQPLDFKTLLAEFGDDLIEMTALAIDKPVEFVEKLKGNEMLELMLATFEVNHAFFFRRLRPVIQRAVQTIVQLSQSGKPGST